MDVQRLHQITSRYSKLRIGVIGDFCLDRYLEIDPSKHETSIETGLPVHNVIKVRAQPGGAGTVINNLSALGIGEIYPIGFCGNDGEGFELRAALAKLPHVDCRHFLTTDERHTFTYCKPLVLTPGEPPRELNRLDTKNWTPTPDSMQSRIVDAIEQLSSSVDAFILLDQVDAANTGVITPRVLNAIDALIKQSARVTILGDSRHRIKDFPRCDIKVNRSEFCAMTQLSGNATLDAITQCATSVAQKQSLRVFITLAEQGIIGALPNGEADHIPAFPVRGLIDIVGAGDAVLANITAASAADATLSETLELAAAAASIVIHQLGTTGTASVAQLRQTLING